MGRKKRTSAGEDLVEVVSWMPWWVGLVGAVLAYLLLHRLATAPLPQATAAGQTGNMVTSAVFRSFAQVGQYLVPVLCAAGAGISAYRRRTRRRLLADVTARRMAEPFADLTWRQFEQVVGELFREKGYRAEETGGGGADGGVDLVLRRGGERYLVQCKQWRAYKVGVEVVRELYGAMAARGAAGGFVVTSGRFTDEATKFAKGRNIQLVDGARLQRWTNENRSAGGAPATRAAASSVEREKPPDGTPSPPACPACGSAMVLRQARRGTHAARAFWGCGRFPSCRGTRRYDEVAA
jgi:restriction system protein